MSKADRLRREIKTLEIQIAELELEGLTTSDAQAVVQAENMKRRHTLGPWSVGQTIGLRKTILDAQGARVAKVLVDNELEGQSVASLIAAAPDLLEALETAIEFIDSGGLGTSVNAEAKATVEQYLSKALAKAKGGDS